MAHHSSTKKAIRQTIKCKSINTSRMSEMRTFIRKFEEAVLSGNVEEAKVLFSITQSKVMKTAQKGLIKKNTGARKVKRLNAKLKSMTVISA